MDAGDRTEERQRRNTATDIGKYVGFDMLMGHQIDNLGFGPRVYKGHKASDL